MNRLFFLMSVLMISCSVHKPVAKNGEELILNGKISRNDLVKNFPWFEEHYKKYNPNDTAVNELKSFSKTLKVTVVMGTWCSDSKEHVSEFFKVADAIGLTDSQIEMIAVDRKKKCATVDLSSYQIEYVPTFILYQNGKQTGSIIETPKETMEKDMLSIIRSVK